MSSRVEPVEGWADYSVVAAGLSENPENKIHTDEVAQALGFAGGLVGGTTVYAYMTRRLVERYGEAWLGGATSRLVLFKPAYDEERLTIRTEGRGLEAAAGGLVVRVFNPSGQELARLDTSLPDAPPPLDAKAALPPEPRPPGAERPLVSWDGIVLDAPFWAMAWAADEGEHVQWSDGVQDPLPLYRGGAGAPLHPGLVLQAANNVFKERYLLPAWIHTASTITCREVPRVGEPVEVRAVPIAKYEKKGHQFVDLYVVMEQAGRVALEVVHSAIFKVRDPGQA